LLVTGGAKALTDEEPKSEDRDEKSGREADQNSDSKLHCSLLRRCPQERLVDRSHTKSGLAAWGRVILRVAMPHDQIFSRFVVVVRFGEKPSLAGGLFMSGVHLS
jgi:hypothetical protein